MEAYSMSIAEPGRRRAGGSPPVAAFQINGVAGVRAMLATLPARRLGITLVSATRKRIVAELAVKPAHMNRGHRVNGGVLMAYADFLGAAGTVMNLAQGWRTTTIESKTNFFAAGEGPVLKAVATPLHVGRSTNVWQTRITNPDGRLVALVTQTQIVLPPPAAKVPR
jgi:1,4-dihydroxy-2-naphthoyl-CoA hydrolase